MGWGCVVGRVGGGAGVGGGGTGDAIKLSNIGACYVL